MRESKIHLAKGYSIPAIQYASQGNAIIGIRRAGKTYGAMKVAEELMDAHIPFIAFDPVGVWKNLKVGINGNKGYPVIVAGGPGSDILLTPNNAVSIVLAAMKAEVSLIIDLFSPELVNKTTWIKIVRESLEALMQQNSNYPLRHIFIEEASEFIPQKLAPGQQLVFSTIERIAKIGRNFGLGFTVINQRSQEIAKSVFELCDFTLMFKQNGKNSLQAVQEWLRIREIKDTKEIISSLPLLTHGECWALADSQEAHRIKILARKTFHPSPEKNTSATKTAKPTVNVSAFVSKLNKFLQQQEAKVQTESVGKKMVKQSEAVIANLTKNNELLNNIKRENDELHAIKIKLLTENEDLRKRYINVQQAVARMLALGKEIIDTKLPVENKKRIGMVTPITKAPQTYTASGHSFNAATTFKKPASDASGEMRILKVAATFHPNPVTKARAGTLAGLSVKSGTWRNYLSKLRLEGMITTEGNTITATAAGIKRTGDIDPLPTDPQELINFWMDKVGSGPGKMLAALANAHPDSLSKESLGEAVGIRHTSGTFRNYLSVLNKNDIIQKQNGELKIANEFYP